MITEADIERMVEACRSLPEPVGDYREDDFLVNLVATVIDFQTHTTAVERAIAHFRTHVRPHLDGVGDLFALMDRWPADQAGNTALARHLWGYDMWTRAQMLRDLAAYFAGIGVTDQAALRAWAAKATFADFRGKVRGLGPAVFQWLVMRQGVDTVKPDVHVHRFVAGTLGRTVSDTDAVAVVVEAAHRLGRPAMRLDWSIWEAGRQAQPTRATPVPVRDPAPSPAPPPPAVDGTPGEVVTFVDDDPAYLAWLGSHPHGYVLNSERKPTTRYLVLHRADCRSINPARRAATSPSTWTVAYAKTCASDASTLAAWTAAQAGPPNPCGMCKPTVV